MKWIHDLLLRFFKFYFNIIIPSMFHSAKWPHSFRNPCQKPCMHFFSPTPPHMWYMTNSFGPNQHNDLMFIGPCIIVLVEEWKTNLMSLSILFHFLCAQHVSDINISIIKGLAIVLLNYHIGRLVLSSLCVGDLVWLVLSGAHFAGWSTSCASACWEQDDRCGNSTTQSQAPDDAYINVQNMLST